VKVRKPTWMGRALMMTRATQAKRLSVNRGPFAEFFDSFYAVAK
jgi:hypothetical protein